jgi:choline dehydrogenase-like flavoprotein
VEKLSASIVIVGSGIGGATTAYALAKRGIDVLIIEHGDYIPKEPENWSPHAIFIDQRYKPNETWIDENNREFVPGVHYFVGGNSKVYGAALQDFDIRISEELNI